MTMLRLLFGLAAILGVVGAALLLAPEWAANQERLLSQRSFVDNLESGATVSLAAAPSIRAQQQQMQACTDWQYNIQHAFYPAETQAKLAAICRDRASNILQRAPTRSAAWMALAVSQWHLADASAALDSLAKAQDTGRHEGWMAVRRLDIALRIAFDDTIDPGVSQAALALAERELPVMTEDARMADRLVNSYFRAPWARDWFTDSLETLPAEAQRLFVQRLRRAS